MQQLLLYLYLFGFGQLQNKWFQNRCVLHDYHVIQKAQMLQRVFKKKIVFW